MASLINRIQRAFLSGASPEDLRALLIELAVPAGGSGENALREARRGFLRPISDEAILRDALGSLGLTGGGTGARPLTRIHSAIMHGSDDAEATLRDGLNDLLMSDDLAGGVEVPAWVPADAVIHIDFLGGSPQGRAWVQGTGEVAIETLLGSDPVFEFYATNSYSSSDISGDGYKPTGNAAHYTAYIGAAKTKMIAGATARFGFKQAAASVSGTTILAMVSEDGNDALECNVYTGVNITSWNGPTNASIANVCNINPGVINAVAFTVEGMRFEAAANGNSELLAVVLNEGDGPPGNPMAAAGFHFRGVGDPTIRSITIYDPLPTTAGLAELSDVT